LHSHHRPHPAGPSNVRSPQRPYVPPARALSPRARARVNAARWRSRAPGRGEPARPPGLEIQTVGRAIAGATSPRESAASPRTDARTAPLARGRPP
jgi:hypothetical protein